MDRSWHRSIVVEGPFDPGAQVASLFGGFASSFKLYLPPQLACNTE